MMRYLALTLAFGIPGAVIAAKVPTTRKAPPGVDKVKVDARTERVIKGALKYLASQQRVDPKDKDIGHWGVKYPVAMTGYALMAFMSTGNLPGEGPYGREVSRGLNYLLQQINEDTGIYGGQAPRHQYMYGHGVATIALAELYGQTRDPRIRKKLQSVVDRIVACQCTAPGPHQGGWRYTPVKKDADISVTVLQCVALRAAKNSGIDVPQQTLDNAVKYVKSCFDRKGSGGFTYQPGSTPGFARTAAAIYSLQVCGLYEDDWVKSGSKYLFKNYHENQHHFVYGSFYAAPAQYMQGGDTWAKWYPMVKSHALKEVKHERDICRWDYKSTYGGAVFKTSVFTMILAMPYHYIPLYQR